MKDAVMLLCYDLSVENKNEIREYQKFLKFLKSNGYDRIQKSIAIKYLKNKASFEYEKKWVNKFAPKNGKVYLWILSYSKYCSVHTVRGTPPKTDELSSSLIEY